MTPTQALIAEGREQVRVPAPGSERSLSLQDLCYTVFVIAKGENDEDGGPTDWFTDTLPKVQPLIDAFNAEYARLSSLTSPETVERVRREAFEEAAQLVERIVVSGPEDEDVDHDDYRDTQIAAAIRARGAIDPFSEERVARVARAIRQTEVNEGEDGWTGLNAFDKVELRTKARAAIAAIHGGEK